MIVQLPNDIIAKIAAGEVITSPYNIIKETLENSIDANAHNITITISNDNLNIEISDDGCGIQEKDFALLCQRHCTSKFDNFSNINSFGFRGEALSSVSIVAKVRVISRAEGAEHGYEAHYNGNEMINLKMKAANKGTRIYINDIFYNQGIRKKHFTRKRGELERIYYLLASYSIYYTSVNIKYFVGHELKECFNNSKEFVKFDLYAKRNDMERKKHAIKRFYKIEDDLLEIIDDNFTALISHINYGLTKCVFVLFINGRMVQSAVLKDRIKQLYASHLPKGRFPFVYIELYIDREDVDVNIHPSKKEVLYYRESNIHDYCIDKITKEIETRSNARIFANTQNKKITEENKTNARKDSVTSKIIESRIVYTDPNSSTLFEHLFSQEIKKNREKKIYKLKSIKELKESLHTTDDSFFKHLVYVGEFNDDTLVQNAHLLMICNMDNILDLYFYQRLIYNLGSFDTVETDIKTSKTLSSTQAEFLHEYFNIKIIDNVILEIPIIDKISIVYHIDEFLCTFADQKMDDEKQCFGNVIKALARFYKQKYTKNEQSFNMLKRNILINEYVKSQFSVVTSLQELYKLFDRC